MGNKKKNLEQRDGFINRHTHGIPDKPTKMKVVIKDFVGEQVLLCEWKPFDKSQYTKEDMPPDSFLGTATVIDDLFNGISFHAWDENNSEFVYYVIIKEND